MQDWKMPTEMPAHDMDIALTMFADHLIAKAPYSKPNVTFERGSKFMRVVKSDTGAPWGRENGSSRSAYAFIVMFDHADNRGYRWMVGDILKPASWKAPAKNFSRGNVLNPKSYQNFSYYGL